MGVVDRTVVDGVPHVWMESRIQAIKVNRKGVRKPKGDLAIMKTLVEESALSDFTNPMDNMRKYAKETIVKTGNGKAIRMREGGLMADMILKAFGANIDFQFSDSGIREEVSVPAGAITAQKFTGSGSVQMKVLFKTIQIESEIETWMSEDIPLGVVKQEIHSTSNGKASTISVQLIRYGTTGATSMIDDADVQEMPGFKLPSF